jgi:hypothetical protein
VAGFDVQTMSQRGGARSGWDSGARTRGAWYAVQHDADPLASQAGPEQQLLALYGDRLVCVRYRYDAQRMKRFKTVELIVAERDWEPSPPPRFADDVPVAVRLDFGEVELRQRVKQAGGSGIPTARCGNCATLMLWRPSWTPGSDERASDTGCRR